MPVVHFIARVAYFFRPYTRTGPHRHLPNRSELLKGRAGIRRLLWLPAAREAAPPADGEHPADG